jgi:hypothetical protein
VDKYDLSLAMNFNHKIHLKTKQNQFPELNQNSHLYKYSTKETTECIGNISRTNSSIFTTLDLTSGFWQIKLDKESQKLTAFMIPDKSQYHWVTSSMGLLDCGASFQRESPQRHQQCVGLHHSRMLHLHNGPRHLC